MKKSTVNVLTTLFMFVIVFRVHLYNGNNTYEYKELKLFKTMEKCLNEINEYKEWMPKNGIHAVTLNCTDQKDSPLEYTYTRDNRYSK